MTLAGLVFTFLNCQLYQPLSVHGGVFDIVS
jgi:hypothetical protein